MRATRIAAVCCAVGAAVLLVVSLAAGAPSRSALPHTTTGNPQTSTMGPVLENFGPVYFNGDVDFPTPIDRDFKALFDVSQAMEGHDAHSTAIESAARFLNMHAQAGVARERLGAAVVLHGGAARYALNNAAYRARYEAENPSLALIEALRSVGARIVICGQTAAARGFSPDEIADSVELALSAMTAIKVLQDEGYQIVAF